MSQRYPLAWPEGWKRTPKTERRNLGSRLTLYKAATSLEYELRKLGAINALLSTNVPIRMNGSMAVDELPTADDPGAAVYFKYNDRSLTMACDSYFYVSQNVRGLALTILAIRAIERHGASDMMERAFRGFTALPDQGEEYWREILEIPREVKPTAEQIEKAFRCFAHVYHPDKGGTDEEFHRLVLARENALKSIGAA